MREEQNIPSKTWISALNISDRAFVLLLNTIVCCADFSSSAMCSTCAKVQVRSVPIYWKAEVTLAQTSNAYAYLHLSTLSCWKKRFYFLTMTTSDKPLKLLFVLSGGCRWRLWVQCRTSICWWERSPGPVLTLRSPSEDRGKFCTPHQIILTVVESLANIIIHKNISIYIASCRS